MQEIVTGRIRTLDLLRRGIIYVRLLYPLIQPGPITASFEGKHRLRRNKGPLNMGSVDQELVRPIQIPKTLLSAMTANRLRRASTYTVKIKINNYTGKIIIKQYRLCMQSDQWWKKYSDPLLQ